MLQITELLPVDGHLTGLEGAPGLTSLPVDGEKAAAGFASLLKGAGAESGIPFDLAAADLPQTGKELPLQPIIDEADLAAAAERLDSDLPVISMKDLVMPDGPAATNLDDPGRSKELATLHAMLPQRDARAAPVAAAVAEAVPAPEKISAPVLPVVPAAGPRTDLRLTGRAGPVTPLTPVSPTPGVSLPVDAHGETLDPAVIRAAVHAAEDLAARGRQAMPADTLPATPVAVVADSADAMPRPTPVVSITATPLTATTATDRPAALPQTAPVEVPVTDSRWGVAVGERVLWMTAQKMHTAQIRMNPAELGPLTVEVRMDDGNAQVTFSAQHAATREALEQALPRLRELFSSEGLNLANADVNEQSLRQGRGEQTGKDSGNGSEGDALQAAEDEASGEPQSAARVSDGLIDTFA